MKKICRLLSFVLLLAVAIGFSGCDNGIRKINSGEYKDGVANFYQHILTNVNNGFTQNYNSMVNYEIATSKQEKVNDYYTSTIKNQLVKYLSFFAVANYYENTSATEYGYDLFGANIDFFIEEKISQTVSGKQYKTCLLKESSNDIEMLCVYIRKNGKQYEMLLSSGENSYVTYNLTFNANTSYALLSSQQKSRKTELELCYDKNDKVYIRYTIQDLINIEFQVNTKIIGIKHNICLSKNNDVKVVYQNFNNLKFNTANFAEKNNSDDYLELNINYSGQLLSEDFGVFEQNFVATPALEAKYIALLESGLIW